MNYKNPMVRLGGLSILALAVLAFLLHRETEPAPNSPRDRPLKVYCAAALKPPMEEIGAGFERETGRRVVLEFGDSGSMLSNVTIRGDGDLFLPADDSFVRRAQKQSLVAESFPLCRMRAVILARPGNPHGIAKFEDLLKPGLRVGIANPDKAAIGTVTRAHLSQIGKWDGLANRLTQFTTVTDAANAAKLGSIDAAIVWDAVAFHYSDLAVVHTSELDGAIGRVELALLSGSSDPSGARRLANYITARDRGGIQLRNAGFVEIDAGPAWDAGGQP